MEHEIEQIKIKVKEFILQQTFADNSKILNESLVFKNGYLDSMGFVSLIVYLESEFNIITQDRDLIEENFESINAIADFVVRKSTA